MNPLRKAPYTEILFIAYGGKVPLRRYLDFPYQQAGYHKRPTVWLWLLGLVWYATTRITAPFRSIARKVTRAVIVAHDTLYLWRRCGLRLRDAYDIAGEQ